jgi:urease subunit alpha
MRPMYGALGKAVGATSVAFMSQAAVAKGKAKEYGLEKEAVAVKGCRTVSKKVSCGRPNGFKTPEPSTFQSRRSELSDRFASVFCLRFVLSIQAQKGSS